MKPLILVTLLTALSTACVAELDDGEVVTEAATEQDLDQLTLSGSCWWGSGQYWCIDYYTKKWCTGSRTASGWDWMACDWTGWRDDKYCSGGWQWAQSHAHCD